MPSAVNSANEEVNRLFREGKIGFNDIPDLILKGASAAPVKNTFKYVINISIITPYSFSIAIA